MIRYAITGRDASQPDIDPSSRLLRLAAHWSAIGIDFVQLREKQMPAGQLTTLARQLKAALGERTRLLINHRADIALASGADGVHLTSHPAELTPTQVRELFARAGAPEPIISVSCHTLADITRARNERATFALFSPIFEKPLPEGKLPGIGLEALREACLATGPMPVLALGGITAANTKACLNAGAQGIAAIRLFS